MSSRHGSNWIDELCDALWQWIWCCRGIAKNIESAPSSSKHILFSDSSFQAFSDSCFSSVNSSIFWLWNVKELKSHSCWTIDLCTFGCRESRIDARKRTLSYYHGFLPRLLCLGSLTTHCCSRVNTLLDHILSISANNWCLWSLNERGRIPCLTGIQVPKCISQQDRRIQILQLIRGTYSR